MDNGMDNKPFDLTQIRYIHRVVVGNSDPERMLEEPQIREQQDLLNRCLNETPRGRLLNQEVNFYILNVGAHQVVVQYIAYHVGFSRKPLWLEAEKAAQSKGVAQSNG